MKIRNCIICNSNADYKCPKCLCSYCSISCYKTHTKAPCQPSTSSSNVPSNASDDDQRLSLLENSEDVKNLLKSTELRHLLKDIDSSPNPNELLCSAMIDRPDFQRFANVCLDIVDPIDATEEYSNVENSTNVDYDPQAILKKLNELLENELSK